MKEAVPILKEGFNPSILFVGSKNVPAPGPGVAPYSVSKSGLTQLARVAALELGKFGIRVNTIHPNAVFDTGIWDEKTIESRAKSYELSVEDYKKRNVLRTVITSENVGDLILQMCSHTFSKTTGAQVPIDGGDLRVI